MASILSKILRMGEGRVLKQLTAIAEQVNALEDTVSGLSDDELRAETDRLKEQVADGVSLDDLLPEAFAVVREAAQRTLGQRHFDVQLMGGAALHQGNIAEMKTGEGKTLVATLPAYLNALTGKGVHVVTVNDYLARYQSELMGRVFRFLGLTTGVVLAGQRPDERREQYAADITYGTNNEFGFDYLRDNMAWSTAELVQRGHGFAIVDEVDSILIDEARTPLIISGPASGDANQWYTEFARLALRLKLDVDYEVDEKKRTVGVLEPGIEKVEDHLGIDNLYEAANTPLIGFLNNSLKVKELFKRDKDYIVTDGEVLIVDEHTGRVLAGRRYSEGMHQAIEAKEGVSIKAENQTLATITLQNYFRLYDKLGGMTGTADTEAAEFQSTYKIGVVPIPTNRSMQRIDQADLIFKNVKVKYAAIADEIVERHAAGQPVLVGTTSVEKSEVVSALLKKRGVPHEVLNAKQHAREASVVAMAGRKGAVTVATNMAGRGTDIMLGGNAEHLAIDVLRARDLSPEETPEEYEAAWPEAVAAARDSVAAEHEEVVELGGLYVLGTERHESRRIDNQLRGRSGRQGDPGESRFYLSMEDDLMRMFNSGLAMRVMDGAAYPDDMPLEHKMVSRGIASAQAQVEGRNFEIRKNVLKYDDVLSRQRTTVYEERRTVLEGEDQQDRIVSFVDDVLKNLVSEFTVAPQPENWDLEGLWRELRLVYPVSITPEDIVEEAGNAARVTSAMLLDELGSDIHLAYERREAELGGDVMRQLERRVLLSVLDRKWREHLYEMDYLKEGIGLRAMGQRDPLVEYQREGYQLFQAMNDAIKEETVRHLFTLEVKTPDEQAAATGQQPTLTVDAAAKAAAAAPFGAGAAATGAGAGAGAVAATPSAGSNGTPPAAAGGKRVGAKSVTANRLPQVVGLEEPQRPAALTYSAPSADGDAAPQVRTEGAKGKAAGSGQAAAQGASSAGGNREARRRAAKSAKKRG
ncbi:preprotein translocase subunit SecA [Georgenia sp. MJ170]|uniref:preprotein translocase subunit SecA n=1 Tax=Georgenia sunbinii TaxID=3117728 RepID=UPI002F26692B